MRLLPEAAAREGASAGLRGHAIGVGGLPLAWRAWRVPGRDLGTQGERGAVVFSHGLHEHGGRYGFLAAALRAEGLSLWALDQRGHGRSAEPSGLVRRFEDWLSDLAAFTAAIQARTDGPLFLLGHSMGGVAALRLLQTRDTPYQGLILSSAAVRVRGLDPLQSRLLGPVASYGPMVAVARIRGDDVSAEPEMLEEMARDPYSRHGPVRARTLHELDRAGARARAEIGRIQLPTLLLHGEEDPLVPADASRELVSGIAASDKELRSFPGMRHELLFDESRAEAIDAILSWIEPRL